MDLNQIAGKKTKISMDDLTRRKKEVLVELRWRQGRIVNYVQQTSAPFISGGDHESSSVVKAFNKGVAIFDGFVIGLRVIKNIRSFFKRKKK